MSFIVITINTDNAAFTDLSGPYEVNRILSDVTRKIHNAGTLHDVETGGASDWVLMDINGNRVGHVECENDTPLESDND